MYDEYDESWNEGSKIERAFYEASRPDELLRDIRSRRYGRHYQIWPVLAERASIRDVGWDLLEVLRREDESYLVRYHCAETLLRLLDVGGVPPWEVADAGESRTFHLARLEAQLRDSVGGP